MKNTVYQGLAFLAMMLSLAACQKSGPASNETGENGGSVSKKRISITATIPETITKVAMTQEDNGSGKPTGPVSLAWEDGDEITISNGTDTEVFELKSVEGTKAIFEGNEITGSSFTITYSKLPDFKRQTQPENASTEALGWEGKLSGVNAITDFTFSSEWANENGGGTFTQSSILRLRAKLPEGVAPTIDCVTIKAFDTATGEKVNLINDDIPQIAVAIENPGAGAETDVVTVYATMPAEDITVPSGKALLFSFSSTNANHSVYTHYRPITSPITIAQGTVTPLNINCPNVATYANKDNTDIGSASNPYLIGDAYQLDAIHEELERADTKYFKLVDDIDFRNTGVVWFPINNGYDRNGTALSGNTFDKAVDFNGNSKTISYLTTKKNPDNPQKYAGLFGVLMGNVYDLTIDHATIYPKGKSGVLAGWVGTGNYGPSKCVVNNVVISNSKVENGGDYVGVLAAQSNKAANEITNVQVSDCIVSTSGYAAGLVAYFQQTAVVSDITVTSTQITSNGHANASNPANDGFAGGICARVDAAVDFDHCSFNGTVLGPTLTSGNTNSQKNRYVGGIAAYVANVAATFDDCKVISTTVGLESAPGTNNNRYVGGAFGYLGAAAKVGETTACSVENLATNSNVRNYVGGFVSYLDGATIKNSTAGTDASVSIGGTSSSTIGGFVGYCAGGTLYKNSTSVNIKSSSNSGGFAGYIAGSPSFEDCHASGNVTASGNNAGGFVGIDSNASAQFDGCSSSGDVQGARHVGGFCGIEADEGNTAFTGRYENCCVFNSEKNIAIKGTGNYVGGFVGGIGGNTSANNTGTVEKCYVKNVSISSAATDCGPYVGGFAGVLKTNASKCYTENITIDANMNSVGGFVGYYQYTNIISDCYAKGINITASNNNIGGFVGRFRSGTITNCYAEGSVSAGTYVHGGFVGGNEATGISKCISWNSSIVFNGNGSVTDCYTKAASETGTVSSHATTLGWDSNIWDLDSGDFPTLIGVN